MVTNNNESFDMRDVGDIRLIDEDDGKLQDKERASLSRSQEGKTEQEDPETPKKPAKDDCGSCEPGSKRNLHPTVKRVRRTTVKVSQSNPTGIDSYKYRNLLIKEENHYKEIWDVYVMVLVFYVVLVLPFRIGLSMKDTTRSIVIGIVIDSSFLVDLILCFITVFRDDTRRLVFLHREIAMNYIKGWFFFDLLLIIPLELFFKENSPYANLNQFAKLQRISKIKNAVKLMKLTKVMRLFKSETKRKLKKHLRAEQGAGRIGYFVVFLFVISHLLACGYLMMALYDERNWLTNVVADLQSAEEDIAMIELGHPYATRTHWQYYLLALYRMMQTITTVGYGDINPVNSKERIYTLIVMIVGVICYGFISGSVATILASLDEEIE